MRRFLLLLMFLFVSVINAATPVYVTTGLLRCGAVALSGNQVQIWCYLGSSTILLHNSTFTIPVTTGGAVEMKYAYPPKPPNHSVKWTWTLSDGILSYTYDIDGGAIVNNMPNIEGSSGTAAGSSGTGGFYYPLDFLAKVRIFLASIK